MATDLTGVPGDTGDLLSKLESGKAIDKDKDLEAALKAAVEAFKKTFA